MSKDGKDILAPDYIRNQRIVPMEEKVQYIKENKERLILPIEGITDEHIDMLYDQVKNNWNMGGWQYGKMLDGWYKQLKR
jgi:hypothetical protein